MQKKKEKEKTWADKMPEAVGVICKNYCKWPEQCDGEADLMESHCKVCGVYSMLEELFDTEIRRLLLTERAGKRIFRSDCAFFDGRKCVATTYKSCFECAFFKTPRQKERDEEAARRRLVETLPREMWKQRMNEQEDHHGKNDNSGMA